MRRLLVPLLSLTMLANAPAAQAEPTAERGAYLARIMDCGGCHTTGALIGRPDPARHLAGSDVGFAIPDLGVFYPPNLTPDEATGIGHWTTADIVKAVRTGVTPEGRELAPVMPWRSYAALSDEDATALALYLKSLPPVDHKAPPMTGASETPPAPFLAVVMPDDTD
ncbi:MAG: c-type cytochrome [Geminicoccaceae bacterium]